MNRNRNNKPRSLKYFVAEISILVLGISVSFLLNEWRLNQRESTEEEDLLRSFRENFVTDSMLISNGIESLEIQLAQGNKFLLNSAEEYSDSLRFRVLSLLNYIPFRSNDITYEEMKSVGSSSIIENDKLRAQIIGVHENGYELIRSWSEIDGEHVRQKLIPFVEKNFPYAPGFNYYNESPQVKRKFLDAVRSDEFRHLVQFGLSYKTNVKAYFELILGEIRETITLIDEDLPND